MTRPFQESLPDHTSHEHQPDHSSPVSLLGIVALNTNSHPFSDLQVHVQHYPRIRKLGIPNTFIQPNETEDAVTSRLMRSHILTNRDDAFNPSDTENIGIFPHWENTEISARLHRFNANLATDLIPMLFPYIQDIRHSFIPSHYEIIRAALVHAVQAAQRDPLWVLPTMSINEHSFDVDQVARANSKLSGNDTQAERFRILSDTRVSEPRQLKGISRDILYARRQLSPVDLD